MFGDIIRVLWTKWKTRPSSSTDSSTYQPVGGCNILSGGNDLRIMLCSGVSQDNKSNYMSGFFFNFVFPHSQFYSPPRGGFIAGPCRLKAEKGAQDHIQYLVLSQETAGVSMWLPWLQVLSLSMARLMRKAERGSSAEQWDYLGTARSLFFTEESKIKVRVDIYNSLIAHLGMTVCCHWDFIFYLSSLLVLHS